jgi:hypothetical protein
MDHYSAFIYTNNSEMVSQLDKEVNRQGDDDRKIDENWYFVSR